MSENIFKTASRIKLKFDTSKGQISVDDLWTLPLESKTGALNLDDIARGLNKQLKNDDDVSFVNKDKKSDETVQLRFDIVRDIIDFKVAANAAKAQEKKNADQKQVVLEIMSKYENEELEAKIKNMTPEERKAMIANL